MLVAKHVYIDDYQFAYIGGSVLIVHLCRRRQLWEVLARAAAHTIPARFRSLLYTVEKNKKGVHLERNPDWRNFDVGKRGLTTCLMVEYSDVRSLPPVTMLGEALTHEARMQAPSRKIKAHREEPPHIFPDLVRTKSE